MLKGEEEEREKERVCEREREGACTFLFVELVDLLEERVADPFFFPFIFGLMQSKSMLGFILLCLEDLDGSLCDL